MHLVLFVVVCLFGFRFSTDDGIPSCVVRPIKGVPSRVSISARFSGGQLWINKGIRDAGSTADFRILFEIFETLEIFDFFETFKFLEFFDFFLNF